MVMILVMGLLMIVVMRIVILVMVMMEMVIIMIMAAYISCLFVVTMHSIYINSDAHNDPIN